MLTGVPLTVTGSRIALFTKSNENRLGASLVRLASGNRVNRPSDGISDYFLSEKLSGESRSYEPVLRDIGEGLAMVQVASTAGEGVFNALTDMRELVKMYYRDDTTADEQEAYRADFEALKSSVRTIMSSTTYNGMHLLSDNGGTPFKTVNLDAQASPETLEIAFDSGDIADVALLDLGATDEATELSAVETERGKAGSYLAKTSAATYGLNAQYSLTTLKMNTSKDASREAVSADTGEEMVQSINFSIRNQSAIAMMAQTNMYVASISKLLGW